MNFQTLSRAVETSGVALHCGRIVRLRIVPREQCGIVFARIDLPGAPEIESCLENVTTTKHATTLEQNGASVSTTEHLLAALWCEGITHARIEIDGPEVPIGDGSAGLWIDLIGQAQPRELPGARPVFGLAAPVWVEESGSVLGFTHDALRVSVAVRYDRAWLAPQVFDCVVSPDAFRREIAAARTFTLEEWIEPLRAAGLIQGGALDNAVVVGKDELLSPLRFEDEMARHKTLDVLGDIALLFGQNGGVLHAHIVATRAGHGLHRAWMDAACNSEALVRIA